MLRRNRIVGVAMIAVAIAALTVAVVKPDPFAHRFTVWAEFDNVNGLGSIDRDIRIAGVNEGEIGEVRRIGDDALVELEVNDDVFVHADAQVALRPHTLFEGSAFVDLHPGSPSAPLIKEGATIPRQRTTVYVSFDEALRVFNEPVRRAPARAAARAVRGHRRHCARGDPADAAKRAGPDPRPGAGGRRAAGFFRHRARRCDQRRPR